MTEPIDTTIRAADMTPAQREAFLAQCKKLESAPSQKPANTRSAKDMTEAERVEWWREHKRRHG
jgi:hypothetical protein